MSASSKRKIGRYEILGEIGHGGMAVVYRAHDSVFNRDVAVKILPAELLHDAAFRARFEREARVIAGLEHPAIVPVYDFGESDGQPYFVMRLMAGGSLTQRIKDSAATNKSLELDEIIRILEVIAPGLDYAHTQGMIHRDLKPDNILFDAHTTPYLADFGIVKLSEAGATLTGNAIVGTPAYMSPEQGRGDADIDGRSDLYSLGAILYECLTNRQVFSADSSMAMILKHLSAPLPNVLDLRPDLPAAIQQVLARVMHKRKQNRYNTATEFVEALKAAAQANEFIAPGLNATMDLPGDAVSEAMGTPKPIPMNLPTPQKIEQPGKPKARKGNPIGILLAAVAVLALLVGGMFGAYTMGWLPESFLDPISTLIGMVQPSATATLSPTPASRTATRSAALPSPTATLSASPTQTPETPEPEANDTPTPAPTVQSTPDTLPILLSGSITQDGLPITISSFTQLEKLQVSAIGYLYSFDVSPDGTTIAVATTTGILFKSTIDTSSYFLPTQWGSESVKYSPDGKLLASANQYETLLIDTATRTILYSLANPVPDRTHVVAFSANGQRLLSGGSHTFVWHVKSGELLRSFENAQARISGLSADGSLVGVPLVGNDINIVNLEDGSVAQTLRVFKAEKIVFSPDGTLLSVVNSGQIVRFFRVKGWEELDDTDGTDIVYSRDGKTLAINIKKNHQIIVYHQDTTGAPTVKDQTYEYDRDGDVGMALSDDGTYFAFWYTAQVTLEPVAEKYAVAVFRVVDNKRMSVLNTSVTWNSMAHFLADGERLVTLSNHRTLQFWNIVSGTEISSYNNTILGVQHNRASTSHPMPHGDSVISTNGVMKAVVNGNQIDLSFVKDGISLRSIKANFAPAGDMALSPDGQTLANISSGGLVRVWRVDDGRQICTIGGTLKDLAALHFSSDGSTIGVYQSGNTLSYWDASNCRLRASYQVGDGYISLNRELFIEFLNGEGGSGDLVVRSLDNGEALLTIYGPFNNFSFDASGQYIEATLFDNTYHAWGILDTP